MTTDVNIMEEMLERATNPSRENVDELGVQMFCMVAKSNVQKAQEMIVTKVQSRNVNEAIRAVALLEECMTKCGSDFQDEVGKFRFLNYLIRLVSKKYEGAETPQPIKQRIMECLLLWTTAYPQKLKIREAYDNLNKEGGVEHGNTMVNVATVETKKDSILGEDEDVLKKLLHSKDPEDYKRANLLIQYRVNQETRRTEFRLQQKSELQEVENITTLLNQMLDTYESDGSKDVDGSETMNLIRELYMSSKRHKPIVQRLIEMNETGDEELLGDILETNDMLVGVMKRYKTTVVYNSKKDGSSPKNATNAHFNTNSSNTTSDLLSALLEDIPSKPTERKTTNTKLNVGTSNNSENATSKTLEELNEIFGSLNNSEEAALTSNTTAISIFSNVEVLEPVNLVADPKVPSEKEEPKQQEKRQFREMREINELSAELFKKSLPTTDRIGSFKKNPEKLSLNDLVKEKINVKPYATNSPPTPEKSLCYDLLIKPNTQDVFAKEVKCAETGEVKKEIDDLMLNGAEEIVEEESTIHSTVSHDDDTKSEALTKATIDKSVTHLSDIIIDLDDVIATADERTLLDDDDIRITLNFTENRPSKHVSVIVMSVENKSKLFVNDFQFEASVKKPNKIRLLPPSETSMPPFKRFRPPMPINQVILLMNPTGKPVDVTCIVGYKLGDDPDPIKESISVKAIPFVE